MLIRRLSHPSSSLKRIPAGHFGHKHIHTRAQEYTRRTLHRHVCTHTHAHAHVTTLITIITDLGPTTSNRNDVYAHTRKHTRVRTHTHMHAGTNARALSLPLPLHSHPPTPGILLSGEEGGKGGSDNPLSTPLRFKHGENIHPHQKKCQNEEGSAKHREK